MEQHHPEPQPPAALPSIRHDGWTGEKMAIFCETLAETGVVEEACEVAMMGVSGAYSARRRSPIFAAAWQAAPTRSPSLTVTKWRKWRTPRFHPVRVTISTPKATSPTAAGGTNPNYAG